MPDEAPRSARVEWEDAHRELVRLAAVGAEHEHALGRALLRALLAEVWRPMGLGSFVEYAERVCGLTPRQLEERVRVAKALEELPRMSVALAGGSIHFSAVRELTRVATGENEDEWLSVAKGKTVGEIQRLVSRHRPGDSPGDPPDDSARTHRVVLELPAEVFALYREAIARVRQETDRRMTDEEALGAIARSVLGGPDDAGRSPYQIRMTVCERCSATTQDGSGQAVAVEATVGETAQCDAQRIDETGRAGQDIPPATRRLVVSRQHGRCGVPGCRHALFTDVHHVRWRSESGGHEPDNLVVLCGMHHAAVHRGALVIDGSWSAGLTLRHADGSSYGLPARPKAAALLADVQTALVGLGFKVREARWMVDALSPHVGADWTFEDTFRKALAMRTAAH